MFPNVELVQNIITFHPPFNPAESPSTPAPHLQLGCDGVDGGEGEGPGAGGAEGGKPT